MISVGNDKSRDVWRADFKFFRKELTPFYNPFSKKEENVEWHFSILPSKKIPLRFVRCDMKGMGVTSSGFGDSIFLKTSMVQAFAEAWERLWMHFLCIHELPSLPAIKSSNGFAAGQTVEQALKNSKSELIERAMLLEGWQNKTGWQCATLTDWKARLMRIYVGARGWKTSFYKLEDGHLGSVLVGFGEHSDLGLVCDAVFIGFNNQKIGELKLMRSLLRCEIDDNRTNTSTEWIFPEIGNPADQHRFYRDPANKKAIDFLPLEQTITDTLNMPKIDSITSKLIIGVTQFPPVAVSFNPSWPQLVWGRQSIQGKNPWPHPLA